jgi:hypothetical protein
MQSDLKKLSIASNHEIRIYGDLEIISMIDTSLKAPPVVLPAPSIPHHGFTTFQKL